MKFILSSPCRRIFLAGLLWVTIWNVSLIPGFADEPETGEWVDLIDDTLTHWRGYRMTGAPAGWTVENGMLKRVFKPGQEHAEFVEGGGDLMTRAQYASFELEFEFNIEPGGNSGVMYRVSEQGSRSYWTGPEYQIMERADRKSDPAFHFCGANYALAGPDREYSRGPGQWNQARIRIEGNRVEHWLNEHQVAAYELQSEDWKQQVADSKFRNRPGYGSQPTGHIVFQDHGSEIAFRNVRVRALGAETPSVKAPGDFSDAPWWSLFNGKDFDNWRRWLGVPHASVEGIELSRNAVGEYTEALGFNEDPKGVYQIVQKDGQPAIRISGEIDGALTSIQDFDNFHLKLEYKWGNKKWEPRRDRKRDSGVLYYGTGAPEGPFPEKSFMRSLECQVQEGDTGDLFMLFGPYGEIPLRKVELSDGDHPLFQYDPEGVPTTVPNEQTGIRILRKDIHETSGNDWNTVEIVCVDGHCLHLVNGSVVMEIKKPFRIINGLKIPLRAGKLQIQSEGAEVFYRNIQVRLIDRIPACINLP